MKRSKMQEQLAAHIEGMGWETKDCDYYGRKILDIIESHGMLPPSTCTDEQDYTPVISLQWEPEDGR